MIKELVNIIKNEYQEQLDKLLAAKEQVEIYNSRTKSGTIPFSSIYHLSDIEVIEKRISKYILNNKNKSFLSRLGQSSDFKKKLALLQDDLVKMKDEISRLPEPEYYGNQEELSANIKLIISKIENAEHANTISQLGLSLEQAISVLDNNNIPFCLNEEDRACANEENKYYNNNKKYLNLSELILVHKTSFAPNGDKITSSVNSGAFFEKTFVLNKVSKSYKITDFRNTIHFCLNGEVSSHAYGDFDNRKYAVLQPLIEDLASTIKGFNPSDTYFEDDVVLNGAYILCPFEERELVSQRNPQSLVVPYKGESVDKYADTLVTTLGYQSERIGMWNWDNETGALDRISPELIEKYGFQYTQHTGSEDYMMENSLRANDNFNKFLEFLLESIKEGGLNPYDVYQMIPKLVVENHAQIYYSDKDGKKPIFQEIDKVFTDCGYTQLSLSELLEAMEFNSSNEDANKFWQEEIIKEVDGYNKERDYSYNYIKLYRKILYVEQMINSDLIDYPIDKLVEAKNMLGKATRSY